MLIILNGTILIKSDVGKRKNRETINIKKQKADITTHAPGIKSIVSKY